ncbi:PhzF family phenazine biosynthesis protein [Alkalicoccobacillus gibsonii]|uniref:PhzF family phenazine biosynthesis protein n=1 Tax=Alkalicoccobacillus gibsonii TaxID=79881 RepID=UPI003515E629
MEQSVQVMHWDVFSKKKHKGNPAGVVLDADLLSEEQMQLIAKEVGFNETSFVVGSDVADFRIRYFTPGHEMNMCGHATMAVSFVLQTKGRLPAKKWTVETKAGIISVSLDGTSCRMQQLNPTFQCFSGDENQLMNSIGLLKEDLHETLPIVYGSTGIWTLLVPIRTLDAFSRMKPSQSEFPNILHEMPQVSIHPFCLETVSPEADMHARHFSSPYSGTIEDAVTGTASGVMGGYYATYIKPGKDVYSLVVEQGIEIGKDGQVIVEVEKQGTHLDIAIKGTATYVDQMIITYK